jgi:hypothetical protein
MFCLVVLALTNITMNMGIPNAAAGQTVVFAMNMFVPKGNVCRMLSTLNVNCEEAL